MSSETAKTKAICQDFLAPWKDADPDIPVLKQDRAEYVNLQYFPANPCTPTMFMPSLSRTSSGRHWPETLVINRTCVFTET
jgi:hypothetical protein